MAWDGAGSSFFLKGIAMRLPVPLTTRTDFLIKAEEISVTMSIESVIDGGLTRTPRAASRDALRLPPAKRAQDSGIVTMLAAAKAAPIILLGANQGIRL